MKKRNSRFWNKLIEPISTIQTKSKRRQAELVSSLLLILSIAMVSGVIYMGFFSLNPKVGRVLAIADLLLFLSYLLSRSRYYRIAPILSLLILSGIPVMNVSLATDKSSESLLILLIWNSLTILLSSSIASLNETRYFFFLNITTLLSLPLIVPEITYANITLPMIFNVVISTLILVLTNHRNKLELDRLKEITQINEQLSVELSERKRAEEQLTFTALHDSLTTLPNRNLLLDRLRHILDRARRNHDYNFAVFFLDLDHFKVVNDSQGHNIGDLLLVESSKRLLDSVRQSDTVGRLGGDEFVILLEDIKDKSDYIDVVERIQHSLSQPTILSGKKVFISTSIGIVLGDERYEKAEDILRDADIAMYRAKSQGRGRHEVFEPSMLAKVTSRMQLETELWKALENHEFVVHYQPILHTQSHQIIGFEALVRWQHPARDLILPSEFIPIAEEIGLIVPMGYWVLDEACRQISLWHKKYPTDPPLTMNVNLSPRQCAQPDLVPKIKEILHKYKLDPGSLKLELTESLVVEDSESTAIMLSQMRDIGIQVQVDDFGTGYSSLSYIQNFPIDALKIDHTFINQLGRNDSGSEIVRTILSLAHNLGMKVIAEGVETDDQYNKLREMNCEYFQGFLFAKPAASEEIDNLLGKLQDQDNSK